MRLAVVASHPVQYQAPLFRQLPQRFDVTVFFACLTVHCTSGRVRTRTGGITDLRKTGSFSLHIVSIINGFQPVRLWLQDRSFVLGSASQMMCASFCLQESCFLSNDRWMLSS